MLKCPAFEKIGIVGDSPRLVAQLSSLFTRSGRYIPVIDAPRLSRPDASNEIIRRSNALALAGVERTLFADLSPEAQRQMGQKLQRNYASDNFEDLANSLKGMVKRRRQKLSWGPTNLGVAVYKARQGKAELTFNLDGSPEQSFIPAGTHLLVACELGDDLSEVIAGNLAFACNASFLVFPAVPESVREEWLEALYSLEDGQDVTRRLVELRERARSHLPQVRFSSFRQVLFVTRGLPWGLAVPEVATTHMFGYPDFGSAVIEGLWAGQSPSRTARNALLIDPHQVEGSEISDINHVLLKNGSLTRVQLGPTATVHKVQTLLEVLPFDIVVISSHAGDAPGERITYEYEDSDGKRRRLTVDRAMGYSWDQREQKFLVQLFYRFHSLDGVSWSDTEAKARLPVGSAITSWHALGDAVERGEKTVHTEAIPRVAGSMALKMSDNIWIVMVQGFAPGCTPFIFNNACSSWHKLGQRLTFAGARGYVGTLFPVVDAEAQEMGRQVFGKLIGQPMARAVWLAQKELYGAGERRPYAVVGLPFTAIHPCTTSPVRFLIQSYKRGIAECAKLALESPFDDVRGNAKRYEQFLKEDFELFRRNFRTRSPPRK